MSGKGLNLQVFEHKGKINADFLMGKIPEKQQRNVNIVCGKEEKQK